MKGTYQILLHPKRQSVSSTQFFSQVKDSRQAGSITYHLPLSIRGSRHAEGGASEDDLVIQKVSVAVLRVQSQVGGGGVYVKLSKFVKLCGRKCSSFVGPCVLGYSLAPLHHTMEFDKLRLATTSTIHLLLTPQHTQWYAIDVYACIAVRLLTPLAGRLQSLQPYAGAPHPEARPQHLRRRVWRSID